MFSAVRYSVPPSGIASRALTQRFSRTWWTWVGSAMMGQRLEGNVSTTLMFFGKVSDATFTVSCRRRFRSTSCGTLAAPWANERIWRTRSTPRSALFSRDVMILRSSGLVACSRRIGAARTMGERTLFRSWAIPEASMPRLSSLLERREFSSSGLLRPAPSAEGALLMVSAGRTSPTIPVRKVALHARLATRDGLPEVEIGDLPGGRILPYIGKLGALTVFSTPISTSFYVNVMICLVAAPFAEERLRLPVIHPMVPT